MKKTITYGILAGPILTVAALGPAALAQQPDNVEQVREALSERPEVVNKVFACKDITESQARLECYDSSVDDLLKATDANEIVVADQAQIKEAKRGLFGLRLPNLKIFGNGNDGDDADTKITANIVRVGKQGRRKWIMVLDNGARWVQTDTKRLSRDPRKGSEIVIRNAAAGSFLANIDGQTAIRVRRIN